MADVNELMSEMGWVRRLAQSLLRDPSAADDIAQEAWLVANARSPDDRPLRPWLHRVVLNLVRMRARSTTRRSARELALEPERMPTSTELLERVETQRMLADEVIALREPYRSTIVLHYVEGLSSAEIARRLGIQASTVRQRLKHALDELRERIRAREDGPKRGWLAALVPFTPTTSHVAIGALAMKKVIATVALILLALLLGGVGWHVLHGRHDDSSSAATSTADHRRHDTLATTIAGHLTTLPSWLAQPGVAPRRIAGRVVFANQPVANATVRIGVLLGSPRSHVPAITPGPPFVEVGKLQTGRTGDFDFGLLPAANFVVSAELDGKAPVSIGVAAADPKTITDHLVLVLGDCRSHVIGTVRDTASPIAHARLKTSGLARTESDATGKFSLCMPAAKYPNIRVEADGYGTVNVQIPPLFGDYHRDVILVPEATISGSVVDEAGQAVPSAVVSARSPLDDGIDEAENIDTVADETGHFQLSGLAPTKYRLGAFSADGASNDHPIVVAIAGSTTRDVRLVVAKRARLRGHVRMNGAPVAGARVGFDRNPFSGWSTMTADSQTDGSFVLDGVPLGKATPNVYPYTVARPTSITVDRTDMPELTIDVTPKTTLRGRVTRHGVAVIGARVECSLDRHAAALSDATGNYVLEGLPEGNGELYADNPMAFGKHPVVLVAGTDQTIDLELDGGGEIRGVVIDEAGASVASVLVRFDSIGSADTCSSLTDANGAFDCATLVGHLDYQPFVYPSPDQQRPYIAASGVLAPVHVTDGDTVVDNVRLAIKHEQLAIHGKVIDDTGATISDARVAIAGANGWASTGRTRADGDGGFVIDGLAPGPYNLRARTADGSEGEVRGVTAGARDVEIKLVRPGTIEGTLVGFTRTPWVLAQRPALGNFDIPEATVTGDHFTFTGVRPGTYAVEAMLDGVQLDGASAEVRSNATTTVTLQARARTTIDGRVVELGTSTPVAGMVCRATLSIGGSEGPQVGAQPAMTRTDASGRFTIDAPIGHDRVACDSFDEHFSNAGGDVEAVAGPNHVEVSGVRLVLPPSPDAFGVQPFTVPPRVAVVAEGVPLVRGDQLLAVDGVPVAAMIPDIAIALVRNHRTGTTMTLQIMRGATPLTVRFPTP
jgi:RNA polymerase sigma-70 factor (ECF subfamily)